MLEVGSFQAHPTFDARQTPAIRLRAEAKDLHTRVGAIQHQRIDQRQILARSLPQERRIA